MALLTNAFHSYGATGNREDLTDFITMISPEEAPLYDALGSVGAAGTYHEWQTDNLAAADANATLEGETFTATARTPTDRKGNRTQLFTKMFSVTDIQDIVNKAGRAKESAYQMSKAAKELKRDFEYCLFDYSGSASGVAGTTTRAIRMQTMHGWVACVTATSGVSGVGWNLCTALSRGGVLSASATGASMTESQFNDILQNIWNEGGKPNAVYLGGALKRKLSDWGTSTSRVWDGSKKITNAVDVYESNFGVLELKLDRYAASSYGYVLDESLWKKAVLQPVGWEKLAKRGLGTDYLLRATWTLEARNASGNGYFISS